MVQRADDRTLRLLLRRRTTDPPSLPVISRDPLASLTAHRITRT
jgi:hypothetical protein